MIPERSSGRSALAFALTTLDGRYHVTDRIAAGGMGEVYRAHDAVLDREVAIKVLHPQLAGDSGFVERFRREARAAAGLSHQNIVAIHDWGAVDGIYYMVMEYVRGQSARELLNTEGVLAPAQVADVLSQTLSALEHAHRQGIVHRDVKPENIMVTRAGGVKVADFGLARAYADAQITEAGMVTGTVPYLAPEQLQGEPADPRTDLYSVGIVAYELLTGRLPFTGETPMAIAYKHIHERMSPPSARNPAVPRSLDGWVASMTEKQRELRPESAAEARRDLQHEARGLAKAPPVGSLVPEISVVPLPSAPGGGDTITIQRPGARARRGRRHRVRWALGILLGLLALAAGAWGAWTYLVPHEVDVPDVLGLTVQEAEDRLVDADLRVRIGEGQTSMQVEAGHVLRVQPDVGATLEVGDRVTIVPSLGPPLVGVPDLVGKPVARARELLRAADLRLARPARAYSDDFAEGRVIEQSAAAAEEAPAGTEIRVVVSDGPFPVPVPNVVRTSEEEARVALGDAGFLVAAEEEFSDEVPRGVVISQDPPRRTELQPGNTVTIVVSLGPREFEMPDVVGMPRDAAVDHLIGLGLEVNVVLVPVPGGDGNTVFFQEPGAGATVRAGDTVDLYVR